MSKRISLLLVLVALVAFSGCVASKQKEDANPVQKNENQNVKVETTEKTVPASDGYSLEEGEVGLFWGDGCPHCANVEKFLEENKDIAGKFNIKKFEVYKDKKGQRLFVEKAKKCGLSGLGVPTLYKEGKCIQGDVPIIEELKK